MTDGLLNLLPAAKIGHIGLYRDETTLEPVEYYCKLPLDIEERTVFLTDPMLATGGSADAAIGFLKARGVKILFSCVFWQQQRAWSVCRRIIPMWIFMQRRMMTAV